MTRDVVFTFSFVTWDGARRRGMHFPEDRLLQTLMDDVSIGPLVVANPFRSLPMKVGRSMLRRDDQPFPSTGGAVLHQPLRLRRRDPSALRSVERAYRRYDRALARAVRRAKIERPAVITNHPLVAGFAPLEWAGPVTFYAFDDWAAHPTYRKWWPVYEEAYDRIRSTGRAVCAVSQAILDRVEPEGPHAVVPNGIEPAEWTELGEPPDWFTALPQPRILYVGTLDSRLDIGQVAAVAESFPQGSVVLVGPIADKPHLAPLADCPSVHIHPGIHHRDVAGLMAGADVCVIPHVRTALTQAMSPLKAYEYLAAGRPVAAVDLPPLRALGDRVVLAGEGDDFSAAVARALRLGPAPEEQRRRFLHEHSWKRRHDRILDVALREDSATA